jgi:hypothetical protein
LAALLLLALGLALAALPRGADAQLLPQLIEDSGKPTLEKQEDGSHTAKFGLANATAGTLELTAQPNPAQPGCELTLSQDRIRSDRRVETTLNVPADCKIDEEEGIGFTLQAEPPLAQPVDMAASPPEEKAETDWSGLLGLPIGLALAVFVVFYVGIRWSGIDPSELHTLKEPLSQLEKTWSFKDSWVANLTVAGTVLTVLVGSSAVVKEALGEGSEPAIALATVGSALALSLVGLGQIFVLATRKAPAEEGTDGGRFTVGGVCGGALLTLSGAFGELLILMWAARDFDLDGYENAVIGLGAAAVILLLIYGVRGLLLILESGTNKPSGPSEPDAATMLVAAVLRSQESVDPDALGAAIEELKKSMSVEESRRGVDRPGGGAGEAVPTTTPTEPLPPPPPAAPAVTL